MDTAINKPISTGTRLGSMVLDHFFMTMIGMAFFIPGVIATITKALDFNDDQVSPDFISGNLIYVGMIGFALYFCKDCINGRSIAKRILKLQLVDSKTGQVANPLRCFVRNIFIIIWPVEAIIALANPAQRLGDKVAGTKLVEFNSELPQPKVNIAQLIISFIIAYTLLLLPLMSFQKIIAQFEKSKIKYVEASYNQQASAALEQMFSDTLGEYLTPKIKIYDKIENGDIKYMKAFLQLKENYLANDSDSKKLDELTTNLIYSQYPKETFTGRIRYIFKTEGHMQSMEINIGTKPKSKLDK